MGNFVVKMDDVQKQLTYDQRQAYNSALDYSKGTSTWDHRIPSTGVFRDCYNFSSYGHEGTDKGRYFRNSLGHLIAYSREKWWEKDPVARHKAPLFTVAEVPLMVFADIIADIFKNLDKYCLLHLLNGHRPKRRGGSGGLNKLCGVTPQLQAIVGQPTMPRTEIVKQLWAYIRKNNLQDPSNKRKIICNEELRLVFEVDCTDMFQMNKLLSKHILPLDPKKDLGQQSKKLKDEESQVPKSESQVPSSEPQVPISEPQVPKPELPAAPIVISEALAKFFGTSKKEMLQSDVYKRIEEYIKTEGLEDILNSTVLCDTKLQELLGCESTTFSAIRDALACNHLFQQS